MGRVRQHAGEVPAHARPSAVLCLLYPVNDHLHVLLMKRNTDRSAHSGQISFPGGKYEPTDQSLLHTAMREAREEVGIQGSEVDVLGALTSLYIPVSNFNVYPFIAYAPQRPTYTINPSEVAHIIEVPISLIMDSTTKIATRVVSPAMPTTPLLVNAYTISSDTLIWGATAMILSELEVLMAEVIAGQP